MLKDGTGFERVVLATGRTDLRRGIDGLVSVIRLNYNQDPFEEGTLYLFCGIKRDRIKGIMFEGDGMVMLTKRLSNGVYQWPRNPEEARTLTGEEFKRLMEGFSVDSSISKKQK